MSGPTPSLELGQTVAAAQRPRTATRGVGRPPMTERKAGSVVAPYLDDGVEAGKLFRILSRSYLGLAGALVVLSFFPSTDDTARVEGSTSVAHYASGNLWSFLAKATDLGCFGFLFMLALVVCGIIAAFRRRVPRRPGLDLAMSVVAALYILLLVTKPDYMDDAEPELLGVGQATVTVLAVTVALGLVMEALALSPGRRS